VNFVEKTKFEIYVEVHHSIDMNSDTPVHGSVSNDKDKSKDLISDDGNGNIDSNNNVESLGQFDDSLFLTQNKYKEIGMTIFIQCVFIMFLPSNGASLRRQKIF
jgi:hypothetical protein